jgi:hypothetical protein
MKPRMPTAMKVRATRVAAVRIGERPPSDLDADDPCAVISVPFKVGRASQYPTERYPKPALREGRRTA